MSVISIAGGSRGAGGAAAARAAADWLALAAAPTFAAMALLTAVLGGAEPICSAEHGPLMSGMVPMYVLMSAFHVAPWLKLIARRPSPGERRLTRSPARSPRSSHP